MHLHILGICGTFMGGVAALAREAGHRVSGSDRAAYPPMSTQLEALGIEIAALDDPDQFQPAPDCVVVGNIMSRGHPAVEDLLDSGLEYRSGPQWLGEEVLRDRWVLAVAGTHGKTTAAAMLAWILESAGLEPGFLIGGIPGNFGVSARLGAGRHFVVEADEYDTAFFDKRSKFLHYRPRTLILNNLEFDHADIFADLEAIKTQFHHLVRTVPRSGSIVVNAGDAQLAEVLGRGCWTPLCRFGFGAGHLEWRVSAEPDGRLSLTHAGTLLGTIEWPMLGAHNAANAAAAVAAAAHAGVPPAVALQALAGFRGVKRRLELLAEVNGVRVYDDFAHHPTAIAATLAGMRAAAGGARLVAIFEPRSNTMRMGVHGHALAQAFEDADVVYLCPPADMRWDIATLAAEIGPPARVLPSVDALASRLASDLESGDHAVIMSNGGFGGLQQKLLERLSA